MKNPSTDAAWAELNTPLGAEGSGRRRYAAAMTLNRAGLVSDSVLEVFRICSPRDSEDPRDLLRGRGLDGEIARAASAASPALVLDRLVTECDRYLAALAGPGIAEVRAGLARWRGAEPAAVATRPNAVLERWLPQALAGLRNSHPALAQAIEMASAHLRWLTFDGYPVEEIGRDFPANHAFASIVGEADAPFAATDWDMGLFLIAPDVLYRDHRHAAPELYAPLTGPHGWRFGPDQPLTILPAHVPVWNEPFVPHLTKVGPEPFLCIYAWTREVNAGAEVVPATDWGDLEALRLSVTAC